jgi:hypothetical protein
VAGDSFFADPHSGLFLKCYLGFFVIVWVRGTVPPCGMTR